MTPILDAVVRFVVTVLFDGLWEAALIAVLAWVALRALSNANATTRHALLAAALLASLVLPVITAALTSFDWHAATNVRSAPAAHVHVRETIRSVREATSPDLL